MARKIKLENIKRVTREHKHNGMEYRDREFCPECGENLTSYAVTEEYVCEVCRHLTEQNSKFCSRCGEELFDGNRVEHHMGSFKIEDDLFQTIKGKIKLKG